MNDLYKNSLLVVVLAGLPLPGFSQVKQTATVPSIQQQFHAVPDSVRPSVYWYWINDNISETGVKKDIESMAQVGIGRAFIGNIGLGENDMPFGAGKLFSDEWWKVTRAAIASATKNGIEIGLFNGPGWSQSGGPWISPGQSMRYLKGDEYAVTGPVTFSKKLVASKADFQDVAVLAFPVQLGDADQYAAYKPQVTSDAGFNTIANLTDGDLSTAAVINTPLKQGQVITIGLRTTDTFLARGLLLHPSQGFRADIELQAMQADRYVTVKRFHLDRGNTALNVGFVPLAPVAVSFPAISSSKFRLIFTNIDGTPGFNEISLSATPTLERFEEKQLAKMFPTPLPLWNEYQWPVQAEADKTLNIDPAKVIDLSKRLSADGTLKWEVPAGNWIIVRYGMVPTGVTNGPASPEGTGLEMDKINHSFAQHHFDSFVGKIQQRIPLNERASLKWVVADSYETGSQNWTDGMADAFRKQYGYDPYPWLPVMSGRVVGTADQSDRFLWDLRRLVADRVAYEYVGGLREVSHQHGLKIWLENYGHWGFPSEFLKYGGQSDEIGGEFWNEGTLGDIECRAASSAAHIYGKSIVAAESFTAGGAAFIRYPAMLKKRGDWSFTEGINNTLLHVFITQPYEDRNPGVNAWFGTEFNRKNTWFRQGKAFFDYIRRCNYLLRQGLPVNDVAYFIGEDAPKMTGVRDPELPLGLSYDYINAEVLLTRSSVADGRLVLPGGMSYRLLVLPKLETMRPELLTKIAAFIREGLNVYGPAPKRSPSLQDYPASDERVKKLAAEVWGAPAVDTAGLNQTYGKGRVFNNIPLQQVLDQLDLIPDMSMTDRKVLYAHRRTTEGDFYFLTNQTDTVVTIAPAFRIKGKQPEWWDAIDGSVRLLPEFTVDSNRTIVPVTLEAYQSGFVVFRKKVSPSAISKQSNFPRGSVIAEATNPWTVTFDTTQRGPLKPVIFKQLIDWTTSEDSLVKNYSGTAIYKTTVNITSLPAGKVIYLDLGKVSVMARVKVNGVDAGPAWTPPYRVDISRLVKKGVNRVEVEVVNTWVNRLIGDSKLPMAERRTMTNSNPFTPASGYQSSGLIGPVTISAFQY